MTTLCGTIEYRSLNTGTKSEGSYAILKCPDGKEYILYRSGCLPADDDSFMDYAGKTVTAEGNIEDITGHFMVMSIVPGKEE